jgi:integrase
VLGPPKSRAGRRIVGIPRAIIPDLERHLAKFVGPDPGALLFSGPSGVPLRRSNFGKMSGWPYAVRHNGNAFAAAGGAGIKDLMARMGHDSERAALIYQHRALWRGQDHY